jgi:hypothetical protein
MKRYTQHYMLRKHIQSIEEKAGIATVLAGVRRIRATAVAKTTEVARQEAEIDKPVI